MRPRLYRPSDDDLVYHYCGADAFHAICSNRTLRFGDLHAMNDFMEQHWGYGVWTEAASALLETVGEPFLKEVNAVFSTAALRGLLLACCFSRDGDVLSQWRAYADDGAGYAIGFSAKDLSLLPASPLEVVYDHEAQVHEATAIIRALHDVEQDEPVKFGQDFFDACAYIGTDLAAFKNPAFAEEAEIRFVHLLSVVQSEIGLKFEDAGGESFGQEVDGQDVQFRMVKGVPSPYLDIDFSNGGAVNPIRHVVLGPKNDAIPAGISLYLETIGLGGITIGRSDASYQ